MLALPQEWDLQRETRDRMQKPQPNLNLNPNPEQQPRLNPKPKPNLHPDPTLTPRQPSGCKRVKNNQAGPKPWEFPSASSQLFRGNTSEMNF